MARERDDDDMRDDEDYRGEERRPRRRAQRDDDYDDDRRPPAPGGLDGFLGNMVAVVLLSLVSVFCCTCVGIILGIVGLATCKTPEGKRGATILLVAGIIGMVVGFIARATGQLDRFAN